MAKPYRISCQTITFGEKQKDNLPEVLAAVAQAGFDGAEFGFRHIQNTEAPAFKALLDKHHLTLMAVHGGGNMLDAPAGQKSYFDLMADYMTVTKTPFCFYSGLRHTDAAQFDRDIKILHRTAKAFLDHHMQLLYHNHNWEFENDGRVIRAILALDNPRVDLCVDVGWVIKGGGDLLKFLQENKDRVGVIHAKDFASGNVKPFVADIVGVGDGVVPFPKIAEMFRNERKEMWVVAEQDFAKVPAAEAVAANARYLKKVF